MCIKTIQLLISLFLFLCLNKKKHFNGAFLYQRWVQLRDVCVAVFAVNSALCVIQLVKILIKSLSEKFIKTSSVKSFRLNRVPMLIYRKFDENKKKAKKHDQKFCFHRVEWRVVIVENTFSFTSCRLNALKRIPSCKTSKWMSDGKKNSEKEEEELLVI